ncbi:MAG: hypothetical protein LBD07_04040 [Spirochaetaceae bacterium]|jgi:hypothetical protein|nr:hypothetical protein [Spirochaetaceae bacterium]
MLQLYFLSVFCNIASGLVLVLDKDNEAKQMLLDGAYRFSLGIVTAIIALLTLISPVESDVPAGDLIPALAGLASGIALIYEHFNKIPSEQENIPRVAGLFLSVHRKTIGLGCIIAGILHFLFPKVMFI